MNKKVLLAKHEYSGIYKNFIWDLEYHSYDVYPLIYENSQIKKIRNFKDKIVHIYKKIILKDRNYKKQLFLKYFEDDFLNKLKNFPDNHFDYSLVIRADFYSINVIKEIVRVCKLNISYHWDGMERFPEIQTRIHFFDKFYVFEEADYNKYSSTFSNIYLTNNFYFENNQPSNKYKKSDVFYIGAYVQNRSEDLLSIYDFLKSENLDVNLMLCCEDSAFISKNSNKGISFFQKPIDYSETLEMSKNSKVVLDFRIKGSAGHKGLSLRFFEAIFHENKIITDNEEVLEYDFYKTENVFILGKDKMENLNSFINSKYEPLENKLKEKYKFINWFNSITEN
jgi:hypothetical protein